MEETLTKSTQVFIKSGERQITILNIIRVKNISNEVHIQYWPKMKRQTKNDRTNAGALFERGH